MSRSKNRRSRADQRRANEQRAGLLKFGIAAIAVLAVGAYYFSVVNSQPSLDAETLCATTPTSLTIIVVDVTDPMNLPQRQDFRNQLATVKNSIPRFGQLSVVRVDSTGSNLLSPVITRCSPGTASDTDELRGNPQKLQKQWAEGFSEPLDRAFDGLAGASGADRSPIMESVQSIALTELQKPGREGIPKRLILASDLLQHTEDISFYGTLPDGEGFLDSDEFRRVRTDLRGVEVELWQLQRSDASSTQPRALSGLWEDAIAAQGGQVTRLYNVSG